MTKSEMITEVANKTNLPKHVVEEVVAATFSDIIPDQLAEGNEVAIAGFGKFIPSLREARVGRNPSSGESIDIPAKMAIKFKPAAEFKNKVN